MDTPITFTAWRNLDGYMECDQDPNYIVRIDPKNLVFTLLKADPENDQYDLPAFKRTADLIHLATTEIGFFNSIDYVTDCIRNHPFSTGANT